MLNLPGSIPGASHYKEEPMSTTGIEPRPTWHRAVALMQEDMGSDNLSPHTQKRYGSAVAAFMAWAVMEGFAIGDVSPDDISRYMEYCREQGFSPRSAGRRLTAIRTLYRSQLSHGHAQSNPAERHRPPVCRAPRGSRGAMSTEWANFIEDYFRDKRHLGRINSEETVRTCRRVLGLHAQDTLAGPLRASREDVKRTLARWEHPNTRAREHTVLVSFYDWMLTEGYRTDNPARQVARAKMRKASVYRLTRMEIEAMIAACETQRERRTILLGVCTGARANELMSFQGRHFAREGFVWFSADIAKGAKERWVPVLPELEPIVEDIRTNVRADHYVITTYRPAGRIPAPPTCRISRTALARIIKGVAERAGITAHIHPHLLRHAFGDHVAKHAGLRAAQALMGHANVQTTASVYVERAGLDELTSSIQGLAYRTAPSQVSVDAVIVAELAVLIDRAKDAGMDMSTIAALASGKEAV